MMNEFNLDISDIEKRMSGAIASLKNDFLSLRTGRASSSMLEPVVVEVYGSKLPLNQCATVTVPESRVLSVNVWDVNNVNMVEKALINSGLGLTPQTEGNFIRLIIPELNEERRKELAKLAATYAENAKIAIRNVRKDGMDKIKKFRNEGMSEDESQIWSDEIQTMTDKMTLSIENLQKEKQSEIVTF
ncbi:ribosome recycling factor [Paracoccaceae bacterium]|nr:ribosome recycling factor [Paracoccaceae bacterium]